MILLPVRRRFHSQCHFYDPSRRPTLAEARIDRLVIKVEAKIAYPSPAALAAYLDHLRGNNSLPFDLLEIHSTRSPHKRRLQVRPGFLLSSTKGHIANIAQSAGTAHLELRLSLNPTRWLAHQPMPHSLVPLDLNALAALPAHEALMPNSALKALAQRRSLNGNDNVLIGFHRTGDMAPDNRDHAGWWRRVLEIYLGHVRALLNAVLVPNSDDAPDVRVTLRPWVIEQAEVYVERNSPDAIADMATLADRLTTAATDVTVCHYLPSRSIEIGHVINSRLVKLRLASNLTACIYAKMQDRVRFEVRYAKDVRATAARHLRGQVDILDILEAVMSDAINRLSTINDALAQVMIDAPVDWRRLADFMAELLWACEGSQDRARALLSPLLIDQAVTQTVHGGLAPCDVMQRLRARGIVQRIRIRHGGPARWVVAPPYAAVLRALGDQLPDRRRSRERPAASA